MDGVQPLLVRQGHGSSAPLAGWTATRPETVGGPPDLESQSLLSGHPPAMILALIQGADITTEYLRMGSHGAYRALA
jgi:hypothetical protein